MKRVFMTAALTGLFVSNNPYAGESYLVYNPHNIAVFEVRFFNVGDGPFMPDWPNASVSTRDLGQQQKEKILDAMHYWAEVITPSPWQLPAIINVGTFNDENAAGSSDSVTDGIISLTQLQGALNGIDTGELTFGSHAQFIMGKLDFDNVPYVPAQLPRTGRPIWSASLFMSWPMDWEYPIWLPICKEVAHSRLLLIPCLLALGPAICAMTVAILPGRGK